jgi:hypothetical protein
MTHIIGKVYDVTQKNMNKLIAELELTQARLKIATEALDSIAAIHLVGKPICEPDEAIHVLHADTQVARAALNNMERVVKNNEQT